MEKILVAGATGTTGKQIVELLKKNNAYEPIALVRKNEQKEQFRARGVQTTLGDLTEDLSSATQGVDKVIFAAGSKGKALDAVDRKGAINLINAGKKHKVKKFIMLSSVGVDAPEEGGDMQEYLQAKRDADEYLANSGLDFTILRPGSLNNKMPSGKIRWEQKLSDRNGEISREDVAQVLVSLLPDSVARREVFEILNGEEQISNVIDTMKS